MSRKPSYSDEYSDQISQKASRKSMTTNNSEMQGGSSHALAVLANATPVSRLPYTLENISSPKNDKLFKENLNEDVQFTFEDEDRTELPKMRRQHSNSFNATASRPSLVRYDKILNSRPSMIVRVEIFN